MPSLKSIDHVHIYVASWAEAEPWYRDVLGFTRMAKFESWAVDGGPLTLESDKATMADGHAADADLLNVRKSNAGDRCAGRPCPS